MLALCGWMAKVRSHISIIYDGHCLGVMLLSPLCPSVFASGSCKDS